MSKEWSVTGFAVLLMEMPDLDRLDSSSKVGSYLKNKGKKNNCRLNVDQLSFELKNRVAYVNVHLENLQEF